jgi:phosphoheptose isomerase
MLTTALNDLIATLDRFRPLLPAVEAAGREIQTALAAGHKLLTAGNGGSAADALHLAEELVGRFDKERPSLPAVCLCADPTLLTCIGNDYGFDRLFSRQVEGLGRPGDVLVVFTTSGNSSNLILALEAARTRGLKTIAVLGKTGGAAKGKADHEIIVPSNVTARIQEVHTFILHAWLTLLEADLQ